MCEKFKSLKKKNIELLKIRKYKTINKINERIK